METMRFDRLVASLGQSRTRRGALALLGASLFGGASVAAAHGANQQRNQAGPAKANGKRCKPKCGFNQVCRKGRCVAAPSVCPVAFDCPDPFGGPAPVCGHVAGDNGDCGCILTTEGNNACVNQTDGNGDFIDYTTLRTCSSSQECRDTVGFHFYCAAVTRSPSGKLCGSDVPRCWPECDNPS
jgi:hypothetical protein